MWPHTCATELRLTTRAWPGALRMEGIIALGEEEVPGVVGAHLHLDAVEGERAVVVAMTPALFMRMSNRSYFSAKASAKARTLSREARSHDATSTSAPASRAIRDAASAPAAAADRHDHLVPGHLGDLERGDISETRVRARDHAHLVAVGGARGGAHRARRDDPFGADERRDEAPREGTETRAPWRAVERGRGDASERRGRKHRCTSDERRKMRRAESCADRVPWEAIGVTSTRQIFSLGAARCVATPARVPRCRRVVHLSTTRARIMDAN